MEVGARPSERRAGPSPYRPGTREGAVFVALVFVGLLAWLANSPAITYDLLGVDTSRWNTVNSANDRVRSIFFMPVAFGVAAFLAGFLFPRGFWLWGVALNLHSPFTTGLTVYLMDREGYEGAQGMLSPNSIALTATLILLTIFCHTYASALGMGVRYLLNIFRKRREVW